MPTQHSLLYVVAMLPLLSSPSFALDDQNTKQQGIVNDVITVTATKQEENVRKIPISVQVTTGEELERKGIYSLEPYLRRLPNVSVSNNYGIFSSPSFRGLATSAFAQESPITVYIDGVPHSSVYGMDLGLLNVERVEFLRGTQSTLYGQSSLGGVVNVITKEPDGEPQGKIVAELAEFDGRMLYGSYAQALIEDVLNFNLAGRYRTSSGYMTNDYPGSRRDYDESESYQYNGTLRWNINDTTHAIVTLNGEDRNNGGMPFYAENDGSLSTTQEIDARNKVQVAEQVLKLEHQGEDITLTYLAAHQNTKADHTSDMDRTNGSFSPDLGNLDDAKFIDKSEVRSFTHEMRLSANQENLRWVAGVYYQDHLYDALDNGSVVPNFLYGYMESHNNTDVSGDQIASFGQASFYLSSNSQMTLGLRWQKDNKQTDFSSKTIVAGGATHTQYQADASWDVWLPKLALSYQLNQDALLYTSVAKGYQSGGFNFTELDSTKARYDPQLTIDYELGVKTSFLDNQFYLDLNLFYLDISDAHGRSINALNQITFFNVDKARSYGAEMDVSWMVSDDWSLNGTFGVNKAQYQTNQFAGKAMANAPEFTSSISLDYESYQGWYGQLSYNYRSSHYSDAENTLKIDGYGLVDLHVGYRSNQYQVYLFASNLLDEEYLTNYYGLPFSNTAEIAGVGQPRTLGLGISYDF